MSTFPSPHILPEYRDKVPYDYAAYWRRVAEWPASGLIAVPERSRAYDRLAGYLQAELRRYLATAIVKPDPRWRINRLLDPFWNPVAEIADKIDLAEGTLNWMVRQSTGLGARGWWDVIRVEAPAIGLLPRLRHEIHGFFAEHVFDGGPLGGRPRGRPPKERPPASWSRYNQPAPVAPASSSAVVPRVSVDGVDGVDEVDRQALRSRPPC